MASKNLKAELQKVLHSKVLKDLTHQLNGYEQKVRTLAKDFNLKSQEARKRSKKQVDEFSARLKKTRKEVEKTLKSLLQQESKLLNEHFSELAKHLKMLSAQDQQKATAAKTKKKTSKSKAKASKRPVKAKGKKNTRLETLKGLRGASQPEIISSVPVVPQEEGSASR